MTKPRRLGIMAAVFIVLSLLSHEKNVVASADFKIMEPRINEDSITVYIKGSDTSSEKKVQIGTTEARVRQNGLLADIGDEIYTLILVDNSASIKENNRNKTQNVLKDLILGRGSNEKMSIATYYEGTIKYLCDYINDSLVLNEKLSELSYEKHKSYLTDVLFEVISDSELNNDTKIFRRIIVISDGSDRDGGKYRSEELDKLIQQKKIPIYTVCCYEKKKDADDIKWLSSLSRLSGGTDYNLTEAENVSEFARMMQDEAALIRVTVIPDPSTLDGKERVIRISDGSGEDSINVIMPQKTSQPTSIPTPASTTAPALSSAAAENTGTADNDDKSIGLFVFFEENRLMVFIVSGILLIAVIVIVTIVLLRKKHKDDAFEKVHIDKGYMPPEIETAGHEPTEVLKLAMGAADDAGSDGFTARLFAESKQIRLKDINSSYVQQLEITDRLKIGKSPTKCDFVISFDTAVSSLHCEIIRRGDSFYINDLNSTNGTQVDYSPKIQSETEIRSGSVIKIGRTELKFEVV